MLFPSLAYAENGGVMSGDSLAIILVSFSTLFALGHFYIVTLMKLGNYFKHLWLLRTSLFLSVVSGLIWIFSVLSLVGYANEFRHHNFMFVVGLFVVSIIILFSIIQASKIPLRQYREMLPSRKIPTGIVIVSMYSIYSGAIYFSGRLYRQVSMLVITIPDIQSWLYLLSGGTILFGFLFFASVYGLWSFQRWGRNFSFGLYIISISLDIISTLSIYQIYPMPYIIFQLLDIGVAVAVIMYLKNDKIHNLYNN